MKKLFINVYEVERCYGGPEEGGWWYNSYRCIDTVKLDRRVSLNRAERITQALNHKLKDEEYGDIYSVSGGARYVCDLEHRVAESETRERPHYS